MLSRTSTASLGTFSAILAERRCRHSRRCRIRRLHLRQGRASSCASTIRPCGRETHAFRTGVRSASCRRGSDAVHIALAPRGLTSGARLRRARPRGCARTHALGTRCCRLLGEGVVLRVDPVEIRAHGPGDRRPCDLPERPRPDGRPDLGHGGQCSPRCRLPSPSHRDGVVVCAPGEPHRVNLTALCLVVSSRD